MDNRKHYAELKEMVELYDYLDTLAEDRPSVGKMLHKLGINPVTMSNTVKATVRAAGVAIPEARIELINQLFKLGVTIGYKYAVTEQMEKSFNTEEENDDE